MMAQDNLFNKEFGKVPLLLTLSISMVVFNAEKTLAIPLKPLLDQLGRRVVEGLFGVGSNTQPLPVNQQFTNSQPAIGDPGAYQTPPNYSAPPTYQPPNYSVPPVYPAPPTYQPPNYSVPPVYPAPPTYQPPNYSVPPTYQPPNYSVSPVYSAPPTYQPPNYSPTYPTSSYPPPTYPMPVYPVYSPARSGVPVIINNF